LIGAFSQNLKYEWENPEEYQERLKAAQACCAELDRAERALNAEAYHNRDARELGYWSGEALQAVFGAEVIKGGASLVKGGVKAEKASKKVAQGTKATKSVAKAAESTEKSAARATKVEQVAQQAESVGNTAQVANAEERVVQIEVSSEASEKVVEKITEINLKDIKLLQEAYLTQNGIDAHILKQDWLGRKAIFKHFDIYRHNKTGELIILKKEGKGVPIQTGEFIN
jgi:hypothetical protein